MGGGGEKSILFYIWQFEKNVSWGGGPLQPPPLMMRAYKIFSRNVAMIIYTVN